MAATYCTIINHAPVVQQRHATCEKASGERRTQIFIEVKVETAKSRNTLKGKTSWTLIVTRVNLQEYLQNVVK